MSTPHSRVLCLRCGPKPVAVTDRNGQFEDCIAAALEDGGVPRTSYEIDVVVVFDPAAPIGPGPKGASPKVTMKGSVLPEDISVYTAIFISGSKYNTSAPEPWMPAMADWLRANVLGSGAEAAAMPRIASDGAAVGAAVPVPMFGLCFGHQMLGWSLGGETCVNPRGKEFGTFAFKPLPGSIDDPVLKNAGLAGCGLTGLELHSESVEVLPPGAVALLATDDAVHPPVEKHQLVRYAPMVYGTQFHPEYTTQFMKDAYSYVGSESDLTREEFEGRLAPTPASRGLLASFFKLALEARRERM